MFIHQFPDDSHNQNVYRKSIKLEAWYENISDRIYWWIKFNNAVSCHNLSVGVHIKSYNLFKGKRNWLLRLNNNKAENSEGTKQKPKAFFLFDFEKGILIQLPSGAQIQFAYTQYPLNFLAISKPPSRPKYSVLIEIGNEKLNEFIDLFKEYMIKSNFIKVAGLYSDVI